MTPATLESSRSKKGNGSTPGAMFHKLSPGPGVSLGEVNTNQRARIEGAMVELVSNCGYAEVSVRGLVDWAGISSRDFYRHYRSVEECFVFTYESVMNCSLEHALTAPSLGQPWDQGLRTSLGAMLQDFADNPKAAQLVFVDSYSAGASIVEQRRPAIQDFEQFLVDAFANSPRQSAIPFRIVEGIFAGVMRVVRTRILAGRTSELFAVADELADWSLSFGDVGKVIWGAAKQAPINGGQFRGEEEQRHRKGRGTPGSVRERILTAVGKLSTRDGYGTLTIPRIRQEAGVSRRHFDDQFADLDACFLEAVKALTLGAVSQTEGGERYGSDWGRRVYQTCVGFCASAAESPLLAQLAFVEVFEPGRRGLECREQLITELASRLCKTSPSKQRSSELAAEASMAAAWRMIHSVIAVDGRRQLAQIAPAVAYVLLVPGLGAQRAARVVRPRTQNPPPGSRPVARRRG